MNRMITALLVGILLCQITLVVVTLADRATSTRLLQDLLRERKVAEASLKGHEFLGAHRATPPQQSDGIQVEVLPDGSVRVDGQWMSREQFGTQVSQRPWSTTKVIHVFAAPSTPLQPSQDVLRILRDHGFEKVTLETR
jgi:biopolymer transport protein ExbD